MVESAEQALDAARAAQLGGAALVEYRVDGCFNLDDDDARAMISDVVTRSPLPCIVTCRIASEGGEYHGDDEARASLFEALAEAERPPRYIDIELASIETSAPLLEFVKKLAQRREAGAPAPRLIVSTHDFERRPPNLARRLERLRRMEDAAIIKVAYRARSLRDNLELFELLRERDRPTIALGMGEFGLMSRVLAPKFGGFLTFAALRNETATAPGQPSLADMKSLYRVSSITPSTRVFGVIGWPVAHSLSPHVHNAGFEAIEFDGAYVALPVPQEWEHFKASVGMLVDDQHLDFAGASVTLPHKAHLVRLAQERRDEGWEIDATAEAAGAGNTLVRRADGWRVLNTDLPAISELLEERIGRLGARRVLIFGSGGAARAAAVAVTMQGGVALLHNRTQARAAALATEMDAFAHTRGGSARQVPTDQLADARPDAIINATPLGMAGGVAPDESPIDLAMYRERAHEIVVFDTVYQPRITPLLKQASELGFPTIEGAEMFVRQAALQFEAWTGRAAPRALFEQIVRERGTESL